MSWLDLSQNDITPEGDLQTSHFLNAFFTVDQVRTRDTKAQK
jgi:hypothetical protein